MKAEGEVVLLVPADQGGDSLDRTEGLQQPLLGVIQGLSVSREERGSEVRGGLPSAELEPGEVTDAGVAAHVLEVAQPESVAEGV
ncbi:hypothetical protein [Streptomyces tanashiensis]|uniref:hypothetical protein n=1 Tax=Streptomyces tanashiensis TaxID=67367 RepID=UPI0033C25D78